jgi:hypothetical protein
MIKDREQEGFYEDTTSITFLCTRCKMRSQRRTCRVHIDF